MKKIIYRLALPFLLMCFTSIHSNATNNVVATTTIGSLKSKEKDLEEANALIARVNEINTMDKSQLSRKERKELREEVKSIDKKLRASHQGVYISVGGLIIIILLLIILL
ncbi:MAG TPA: hypothetical protein VFL70_05855 [Bacteroidia bacterium]|nr:hypothetical protein [Bacteroidia bacterium]